MSPGLAVDDLSSDEDSLSDHPQQVPGEEGGFVCLFWIVLGL